MKKYFLFGCCVLYLAACTTTQPLKKSDADFSKALEESEKNNSKKLDFLADEKLPNDEFTPPDSVIAVDTLSVKRVDYKEIIPASAAKYRVQVFAGSAENAYKNYSLLSSNPEHKEVYMIQDQDGKWKVWTGGYTTHDDAEKARDKFRTSGYPDAWINEMKGKFAPAGPAFWLQIGSFSTETSAQKAKADAESRTKEKVTIEMVDKAWKVRIGGYAERSQADELKAKLQNHYPKAFVVRYGE
jgi:cell division septation protein DedD